MQKIAIIDGKSVFYRGYYAMGGLSLPDGTPTGGVYGFISILLAVIEQIKPDNVYVAWDIKGTSTSKRSKLYPQYKAGRAKPPEDFYVQIPILKDILTEFGIPFLETDNYEADDIIATLANQIKNRSDCEAYLVSSDLDMLQLLSPNVEMWALKTGLTKIEEYTPATFEKKYGLKVAQFLDLKSLQGDSSDNIPGVPGIGPKTATELLQKYDTLEQIYDSLSEIEAIKPALAKKLIAGKESAFLSKELARLYYDAPVEMDLSKGRLADADIDDIIVALDKLSFRSLKARFRRLFPEQPSANTSHQLGLFGSEPATASNLPTSKAEKIDSGSLEQLNRMIEGQKIILEIISNMVYVCLVKTEQTWSVPMNLVKKLDLRRVGLVASFDHKKNMKLLDDVYKFEALDDLPFKLEQVYDLNQAEFLLDPLTPRQELNNVGEADLPRLVAMFKSQLKRFVDLKKLAQVAKEIDFPLIPVLFLMEKRGVKIDKAEFARLSSKLGKELGVLEAEIHKLVGKVFNLNSPLQLSDILFNVLNLPTKGIKKTKSGFSTGKNELDKLQGEHEVIGKIKEYREISKIKSTYVDALPKQTDDKDILHTTFNQDVTATGRLSSANPNLQNIPVKTELGQAVRKGFIARDGNVLVSVDYAQDELRVAAALSDDQDMIDIFNTDRDIHTEMAAQIFSIAAEDVTKEQRRIAKVVNFSVLYGAGPRNLQQTTGLTFKEAKDLIERYFALRHKLRDFMDKTLGQAEDLGYVETYFGRRRPTPDIKSSNFQVRESAKRASANMPIQGTAADLMKLAMIRLEQKLVDVAGARQILQIHDSILIEVKAGDEDRVKEIATEVMTNVCPELPVKFTVDIQVGQNWQGL